MARSSRVLLFVQLSSLVARADTSASTPKRNCRSSVRQARNHALSSSGAERHAARGVADRMRKHSGERR
jgi:hypothetical protein